MTRVEGQMFNRLSYQVTQDLDILERQAVIETKTKAQKNHPHHTSVGRGKKQHKGTGSKLSGKSRDLPKNG